MRVISLDKKLVQANEQKLCVVFVVNELALRLRAGFRRSKSFSDQSSDELSFLAISRSMQSSKMCLCPCLLRRKKRDRMELESERNEELRWILLQHGSR